MSDWISIVLLAIVVMPLLWLGPKLRTVVDHLARPLAGTRTGFVIGGGIFLSACAWCSHHVLEALSSGAIRCFGKACRDTYVVGTYPWAFWITLVVWSALSLVLLLITIYCIGKFVRAKRDAT